MKVTLRRMEARDSCDVERAGRVRPVLAERCKLGCIQTHRGNKDSISIYADALYHLTAQMVAYDAHESG